jgi:diamine N-acetyltransferase
MFVHTFAADNAPSDLALYLPTAFSTTLQQREIEDPACTYLLAHDHEAIVAYAKLSDGAHSPLVKGEAPIELQRFYVDHRYHGRGLAAQMMSACVDVALGAGAQTLWLGVWEQNAKAIRFYEKCGFAAVGHQHFLLGTDRQSDRVMMRSVSLPR